jgi:HK97 family phage prohead protease
MTEYRRTDDGVETPERESRAFIGTGLELRFDEGKPPTLSGYALVYENRYDIGGGPERGGFTETIARGAAAKSAKEADVRLLINHTGLPLARTKSGTLTLESDDIGLRIDAELDPANPSVIELRSAMARRDADEMSFAFRSINDQWDSSYEVRTIKELALYDVSVVTYPANPATVAQMRNAEPVEDPATEAPVPGRSLALARRQLEVVSHG